MHSIGHCAFLVLEVLNASSYRVCLLQTAPIVGASLALMCLRVASARADGRGRIHALPPISGSGGANIPLQIEVRQEYSTACSGGLDSVSQTGGTTKAKESAVGAEWA
jgi:hypothetical protein